MAKWSKNKYICLIFFISTVNPNEKTFDENKVNKNTIVMLE